MAILVVDEYQDVATSGGGTGLGDDRYLAKARESMAVMIAATQSVSSLENAIRNESATQELLQNFRTRTFGQTTDPKTVRLYQESFGQSETERVSQSISESAPNGGEFSVSLHRPGQVSEGLSVQKGREYLVTAKEFARLRPFESFAQIYDGVETKFEKLFIKPYYLDNPATPHETIIASMKKRATAQVRPLLFALALLASGGGGFAEDASAIDFPNMFRCKRAGISFLSEL